MNIEKLAPRGVEVEIFGEKLTVEFTARTFMKLKEKFGIDENTYVEGIKKQDPDIVSKIAWAATLEFDSEDPLKIIGELPLQYIVALPPVEFGKLITAVNEAAVKTGPFEEGSSSKKKGVGKKTLK